MLRLPWPHLLAFGACVRGLPRKLRQEEGRGGEMVPRGNAEVLGSRSLWESLKTPNSTQIPQQG